MTRGMNSRHFLILLYFLSLLLTLCQCTAMTIDVEAAKSKEVLEMGKKIKDRFKRWSFVFKELGVKRAAEIGVWEGDFAHAVLSRVDSIEEYYLVDPWKHLQNWDKPFNKRDSEFNTVFIKAMKQSVESNEPWANKAKVLRGSSLDMASKVKDGSLDMVYIDGDHTARGTMIDLLKWFDKVRPGGLLCGDDFTDSFQHGKNFAPTFVKSVVSAFAEVHGLVVVEMGQLQWAMLKTSTSLSGDSGTKTNTSMKRIDSESDSISKSESESKMSRLRTA